MSMKSPTVRTRAPRSGSSCIVALALTVLAGAAGAKNLPAHDALADARPVAAPAASAVPDTVYARFEDRLNLPSFLHASDSTPRLSASLLVSRDPATAARSYLTALAATYRLDAAEVDALPVIGQQRLENGAAIVQFGHSVQGIEVFRERASVLVQSDGALVAIGGYVSGAGAALDADVAAQFARGSVQAASAAYADYGLDRAARGRLAVSGTRAGYDLISGAGTAPARAKRVWFRLPQGLVPAHYVEIEAADARGGQDAYAYVIGAKDGTVLFRKNLRNDATAYGYRVFAESSPPYLPYPGPQGRNGTPHPTGTPDGYQAPFVRPNLVSLVNAISAPTSAAINDPWLPDGATETVGNNVDAYADLSEPDGYQPQNGDYRADLTDPANHYFDRAYNTALDPQVAPNQVKASTVNLFYLVNWLHDWYYDAGFDEAAGNAQLDNYGRGGIGGDVLLAQAQDYAGLDNADMATPADGGSPRMRMYVFSAATAARLDYTAGLSGKPRVGAAYFGAQNIDLERAIARSRDAVEDDGTDTDGCSDFSNAAEVAGRIAFVDRGGCSFDVKVKHAQVAGAVAAIIGNVSGSANRDVPPNMILADEPPGSITIPSVSLAYDDAQTLRTALGGTTEVKARLRRYAGTRRDGTLDNTIIAHEWAHYLSNRLVGNASGLSTNQSGGMGEGFSDFHALLLTVTPEDALLAANLNYSGTYAEAGYVSSGDLPKWAEPNQGYYYGLRRYPYSTDLSKNPLTFKYVESGVDIPPPPFPQPAYSDDNAEVHATGEIWANTLWECYASLLRDENRLSFAQAQDRMKRYMVAGYKLMPPAVDFVEARDAILSVMRSQDPADFAACAAAFAKRGLGAGAQPPTDRYGRDNAGVKESFGSGPAAEFVAATLTDSGTGCDNDGVLDAGETGTLVLRLRNAGFANLTGASITLSTTSPGVTFPTPTVTGQAVAVLQTKAIAVPIKLGAVTGTPVITVGFTVSAPGLAQAASASQSFLVNTDVAAQSAAGTGFETPGLAPFTVTTTAGAGTQWERAEDSLTSHFVHGPDPGGPGITALVTPPLQVAATGSFGFTFKSVYAFETGYDFDTDEFKYYDGGVIEYSTDDGATWADVNTLAGARLTPGYGGTLVADGINPLRGRDAYVFRSPEVPDYNVETVDLGTSLAGRTIRIRFAIAADVNGPSYGWDIDDLAFTGLANTPFPSLIADRGNCALDVIFANGFEQP